MQVGQIPLTKQTLLVALVLSLTLTGAGIGALDALDGGDADDLSAATSTPTPPSVEPTSQATPTQTATANGTPTTTEPTTEPGTETGATETEVERSAELTIDATDPDDVANAEGQVPAIRGDVSGTLTWSGDVDSVVLVVSSWSPSDGWTERRRTTVAPANRSVTLADALNRTNLLYATGDRAAAFDNSQDETEVTRRGYIGVTAVLYDDGEAIRRLVETTEYSFDVRNVGTVDLTLSGVEAGQAAIEVANASPADTGSRTLTVANDGSASGTLQLFLRNVTGAENSFTDAEATVDDDQRSELLDAIGLRIAAVDGEGQTYLLGDSDRYATLGEIGDARLEAISLSPGESLRIVVEWHLPASVGNEVMTDSVNFDLQFQLVSY